MSSFEESIAYARLTNVTKSVTNCRISVTSGSAMLFFASVFEDYSTNSPHVKKAW